MCWWDLCPSSSLVCQPTFSMMPPTPDKLADPSLTLSQRTSGSNAWQGTLVATTLHILNWLETTKLCKLEDINRWVDNCNGFPKHVDGHAKHFRLPQTHWRISQTVYTYNCLKTKTKTTKHTQTHARMKQHHIRTPSNPNAHPVD